MTGNDRSWNGVEGLTAEQVEKLNDSQRRNVMPDADLHGLARSMAADNLTSALYGDVAPPADALVVHGWWDDGDDGEPNMIRTWTGRRWKLSGGGRVEICGVQDRTGATTRAISVDEPDGGWEMTPAQARELASALLAAISEIGRVTESEGQL